MSLGFSITFNQFGIITATALPPFPQAIISKVQVINGIISEISPPLSIPLAQVPNQRLNVTLNNQPCQIHVYQKHLQVPDHKPNQIITNPPVFYPIDPIFLDLEINFIPVISGVLCHDRNLIVRDAYLGFKGDLSFYDSVGTNDPAFTDFGTRYLLLYWPP